MNVDRNITVEHRLDDKKLWNDRIKELIHQTVAKYGKPSYCAGIDLRLNTRFVMQEILGAHTCIRVVENGATLGFALIKEFNDKFLYVTLIVSFSNGVGGYLMKTLRSTAQFAHQYLILRSTDAALRFYLKQNFLLVDWNGLYTEAGRTVTTDFALTEQLDKCVRENKMLTAIRTILTIRDWCDRDTKEWPLIACRDACAREDANSTCRRSERLRAKNRKLVASLSL